MREDKYLFYTDDGAVHVNQGIEGLAAKFADFFQRSWFELTSISSIDDAEVEQLVNEAFKKTVSKFDDKNNNGRQLVDEMLFNGAQIENLQVHTDKIIITFKITSKKLEGENYKTTKLTLEVLRR
jgi:hypothetical protein